PAHTITGNRISKLSSEGTGNVYVNGIYLYTTASTGTVVEGNTIDSLSVAGTGHITGLYYRTGTGTGNILRGNTVHALYSGSGSPTMYGIQLGAGSAAVDSNLVQGITSVGYGTVYGMYLSGSTIPTADNVIHSLGTDGTGTTSSTVVGLQVAAISSGT